MGCASSKEKVCQNCQGPYSPVRRSYSMHVHHLPQETVDSYHLVALTSSTLGSLKLDDPLTQSPSIDYKDLLIQNHCSIVETPVENKEIDKAKVVKEDFAMGMIEAKTWSKMTNEKIPKIVPITPIWTPPGEPELINVWELMEGLDDISPLRPSRHLRGFSFHASQNPSLSSLDEQPTPRAKENGEASPKPLWLEMADNDSCSNDASIVSEFDPEVIATFRSALEEDLPLASPVYLKDEALVNKIAPRGTDKLIVYFTSLRGVRKTYEDCCHVRVILKGLGVKVDERDVSMHSGFKEELKDLLGEGFNAGGLPRVFLGRKHIGGAEEIRRLNEDGKLEKVVKSCQLVGDGGEGGGYSGGVCEACGDVRFVPCETCSGSCKIYHEDDYNYEEHGESKNEHGFHRCHDCNENGLIRCPICCD
ncbi:uncharacterized protein At5g39865-like [Olea europaea var. sylvestris]|uniref:uncharacterized protein At5g39865-like n=1 Tax=Olea europaea var. sylvestris TaxID=158386 RepID=UPI000C1D88B9|nr:uncharacterized protein At5g39865-like [Olea europaea var. sylvestris]